MPTQSKKTTPRKEATRKAVPQKKVSQKTVEALKPRLFHILLALADTDQNGLEIMREVLEATGGRLQLWPGTLYGSLRELVGRGLVAEVRGQGKAVRGGSPRFYRLTSEGRATLQRELLHMESLLALARAKKVLPRGEPS